MCNRYFCCWHYSIPKQKCTYYKADNLHMNADDECYFPNEDVFDDVCEFEDTEEE